MHCRRRSHKVLSGTEVERLAAEYLSGKTVYELGREFGIHRTTVGIILKRHGVKMRRQGIDASLRAEIIQLRQDGWSYARLGERYGVDPSTISNFLRRDTASK